MTNKEIQAIERKLQNAWSYLIKEKLPPEYTDAIAEIVECELLLETESNK